MKVQFDKKICETLCKGYITPDKWYTVIKEYDLTVWVKDDNDNDSAMAKVWVNNRKI